MPKCEAQTCRARGVYRPDHQAALCDTHAEIPSYPEAKEPPLRKHQPIREFLSIAGMLIMGLVIAPVVGWAQRAR